MLPPGRVRLNLALRAVAPRRVLSPRRARDPRWRRRPGPQPLEPGRHAMPQEQNALDAAELEQAQPLGCPEPCVHGLGEGRRPAGTEARELAVVAPPQAPTHS